MTIKKILKKYNKIEIELLLAHVLRKTKEFVFMHPDYSLSADQLISLSALIKRREKGEPIAYILGYKDFYGMRFKVNRSVLIPRPETELIIERFKIERLKDCKRPIRILDVGTGSGCIAVSLAKQFSIFNFSTFAKASADRQFSITASDVSPAALKVAKQNAKTHKVKIKFVKSDLLKNVKGDFDVVIANLPYVPESDYKSIAKDLKFEPKSAIFQKEKGLYLIRRLLEQIALMKFLPKFIYLEFDPRQKQKLSALIKKSLPGSQTNFYKDYNNFWRYAEIMI